MRRKYRRDKSLKERIEKRKEQDLLAREAEIKREIELKPWLVSSKSKLDFEIYAKSKYEKDIDNPSLTESKIVAYTSLSPSHHNVHSQRTAIESWRKLGIDIYSFNNSDETIILKNIYPDGINFICPKKTTKHLFGKPYVIINEMIDHFYEQKTGDILMLINSDIILDPPLDLFKKVKSASDIGVIISARNDYAYKMKDSKKYPFGFDVFFIHNKFTNIFPPAMYSMGQTWWDYWIPYTTLKNKVPLFIIKDVFAFHKEHPKQYNDKDWNRMTEYFKFENDIIGENHQSINNNILNDIINNSIIL